jgi:hypothetical protein
VELFWNNLDLLCNSWNNFGLVMELFAKKNLETLHGTNSQLALVPVLILTGSFSVYENPGSEVKKIAFKGIVSRDWGRLQIVLLDRNEVRMILLDVYWQFSINFSTLRLSVCSFALDFL